MRGALSVAAQFAAGLVFGLGLILAGMADPAKVLNFLDLGGIAMGLWDPSLAFVMGGGVAVAFVGFRLARGTGRPFFANAFPAPPSAQVDRQLIIGPALFGIGWGLAGLCPGPAFVSLGVGSGKGIVFVAAMVLGMAAARLVLDRQPAVGLPASR